MTDTELLMQTIKEKGIKLTFIANKLGLTYAGLKKKIDNEIEFKPSEIKIICDILNIKTLTLKEKIFFKVKVGD